MERELMRDEQEVLGALSASVDRLSAAAVLLERTIAGLEERQAAVAGEVGRVVAAIEAPASTQIEAAGARRETELERRLEEAESQIVELRASRPAAARKTIPSIAANLLAKQGIHGIESIEAGALDAALTGLSLEQRIAVKSQLLRAGALVQG